MYAYINTETTVPSTSVKRKLMTWHRHYNL